MTRPFLLILICSLSLSIWSQTTWEIDSSFADNGQLVLDIDELDEFSGIIYDDHDNAYFYGSSGNYTTYIDYDFVIGKLNSFGDLDTTFGTNGIYTGDFFNQTSSHVVEAFYRDGHITFLAQAQTPSSLDTSYAVIVRIDTMGCLDSSFATNGVFGGPVLGLKTKPNGLDSLSNGKVMFTGVTFDTAYTHREVALVGRLTEDGVPDSSFGGTGFLTWDYLNGLDTADFFIPSLVEKHDLGSSFSCAIENPWGDYLIGGYLDVSTYTRSLAVRITTNGELVSTFGYGGHFSFDHIPDNNNYVVDMNNWQGKVLITTNEYAQSDFILTSITETSAVSSWTEIDFQGNIDVGKSSYVDANNDVYVTGYTKDPSLNGAGYSSQYFGLTKLNDDLTIDTSFVNNGYFTYDFQSGDEHGCSDFGFFGDNIILGGYLNNLTPDNYVDFGFVRLKKTDNSLKVDEVGLTWTIYPNPTQNEVNISLENNLNKPLTVELYAITGELVKTETIQSNNSNYLFETGNQPAGVYILNCRLDTQLFTTKIYKQ